MGSHGSQQEPITNVEFVIHSQAGQGSVTTKGVGAGNSFIPFHPSCRLHKETKTYGPPE